ncbi:hypothetical protein ABT093_09715 [Kitasatospora sp. NPDC002551]|uniref:hypothetical protein n=1 Tax=Kitasatospora sp. NPDC002551 TaxID=3154539 RepID=UPI003330838C
MPVRLTADELRAIADALDTLAEVTARTMVEIYGYDNQQMTINGNVLTLAFDRLESGHPQYALELPD